MASQPNRPTNVVVQISSLRYLWHSAVHLFTTGQFIKLNYSFTSYLFVYYYLLLHQTLLKVKNKASKHAHSKQEANKNITVGLQLSIVYCADIWIPSWRLYTESALGWVGMTDNAVCLLPIAIEHQMWHGACQQRTQHF